MTPEEEVAKFNSDDVGVQVIYSPGAGDEGVETRTTKKAQIMYGRAVVWVEGHTGCVPLNRVVKIKQRHR